MTEKLILEATKKFLGKIQQKPPIYSAIKKDGKRLYESARKGIKIDIDSREIEIHKFLITKINLPNIEFEVKCSKGTYIRSLANDFGVELKCGATLTSLKRTKIGEFDIKNSISIEDFTKNLN